MTRGTFVLFTEEYVYMTTEFNGDMYGKIYDEKRKLLFEGHGTESAKLIKSVKTENDLRDVARTINRHYEYEDREIDYIYKYPFDEKYLNMREDYFLNYFSDYLFIKNESGYDLEFFLRNDEYDTRAILEDGKSGILNFGGLCDKGMFDLEDNNFYVESNEVMK